MFAKASTTLLAMGMAIFTCAGAAFAQSNVHTASISFHNPTAGQDRAAVAMRIYDETKPPIGYVRFCQVHSDDCRGGTSTPRRAVLTADRWVELNAVNTSVNTSIVPVTDIDLYKTLEYWTYPSAGQGDCEDYVLLKRRELIGRGWPAESLLITVVTDEAGDGHAILTVVTDHGDFVLDNKTAVVLRWNDTPYTFKKRQSMTHPSVWVSLTPERDWFGSILPASPR